MELRRGLRQAYLTVQDLASYGPMASRLGFQVLEDRAVQAARRRHFLQRLTAPFWILARRRWLAPLVTTEWPHQFPAD